MIQRNLLIGKQVRLTGLTKEDAPTVLRWREDTRFLRLWSSDPLVERNQTSIISWIEQLGKTKREVTFAIRLHEQEDLIGIVSLAGIEWPNRVAYLGIGIGDPEHWGKGYGTEATQLMIEYGFSELNQVCNNSGEQF